MEAGGQEAGVQRQDVNRRGLFANNRCAEQRRPQQLALLSMELQRDGKQIGVIYSANPRGAGVDGSQHKHVKLRQSMSMALLRL